MGIKLIRWRERAQIPVVFKAQGGAEHPFVCNIKWASSIWLWRWVSG